MSRLASPDYTAGLVQPLYSAHPPLRLPFFRRASGRQGSNEPLVAVGTAVARTPGLLPWGRRVGLAWAFPSDPTQPSRSAPCCHPPSRSPPVGKADYIAQPIIRLPKSIQHWTDLAHRKASQWPPLAVARTLDTNTNRRRRDAAGPCCHPPSRRAHSFMRPERAMNATPGLYSLGFPGSMGAALSRRWPLSWCRLRSRPTSAAQQQTAHR
jgi:hypothetical protein